MEKLTELRKLIDAGEYWPSAYEIADAIIKSEN
ncbi:MAG: hypothetical protein ABIP75_12510 [Pyrinomonadaceae bacterium]